MSIATLEDVEYAAWHLAAIPDEGRMDKLRGVVLAFRAGEPVPEAAGIPQEPEEQPAPVAKPEPVLPPEPLPQPAVASTARQFPGAWKECRDCHKVFLRHADPPHFSKDKTTRDGLRNACKACDSKYRAALKARKDAATAAAAAPAPPEGA